MDRLLADLREAVEMSRKDPLDRLAQKSKYALAGAAMRILPGSLVEKLTSVVSTKLGLDGAELPERTAPIYGMIAALPNRGNLKSMVLDVLDKMTRPHE